MTWGDLLCAERFHDNRGAEQQGRNPFSRDADRVMFSAPFRRLANKTQVHPLYEHDHLHHRLIHSVETGTVGHTLGLWVGERLEDTGQLPAGQAHQLAHIVNAACLAHDIGNPPFGHAGEDAIGEWFHDRFASAQGIFADIAAPLRTEFEAFEGNAQGFRLLTRLEMYPHHGGMRLTKAVLGAFSKYTCTAAVGAAHKGTYIGTKKYGVFESEAPYFNEIAARLGLRKTDVAGGHYWSRHPLAFLVEAADDICYNILDLEDGFVVGELSFDQVVSLLEPLAGKPNRPFEYNETQAEQISFYRAKAISAAIAACVDCFMVHYDAILDGRFSSGLTETCSKAPEFAAIKALCRERLFVAPRKTSLEVAGREIIFRLLDRFADVFDRLSMVNWDPEELRTTHDYSAKLIRAVDLDMRGVQSSYQALHALTDFISGMTDRYAVSTLKMIEGRV